MFEDLALLQSCHSRTMDVQYGIPQGVNNGGSLMRKPYFRLRDGKPELAGWIVFEKGILFLLSLVSYFSY